MGAPESRCQDTILESQSARCGHVLHFNARMCGRRKKVSASVNLKNPCSYGRRGLHLNAGHFACGTLVIIPADCRFLCRLFEALYCMEEAPASAGASSDCCDHDRSVSLTLDCRLYALVATATHLR